MQLNTKHDQRSNIKILPFQFNPRCAPPLRAMQHSQQTPQSTVKVTERSHSAEQERRLVRFINSLPHHKDAL